MLAAEPMRAETELRDGYDILDRIGDVGHLSSFAPDLGDAVYEQGRYDEAYLLSEIGERITIEGDVDAEVRWRLLRGKTLARRGRLEEAEALAEEAVRLSSKTDYLDLHAHALMGLAEIHRLARREPDAVSALREALDLHRRKGNLAAEARIASLLADLGEVE
jgi:tetratricopeptide (TPR) repeat protein